MYKKKLENLSIIGKYNNQMEYCNYKKTRNFKYIQTNKNKNSIPKPIKINLTNKK